MSSQETRTDRTGAVGEAITRFYSVLNKRAPGTSSDIFYDSTDWDSNSASRFAFQIDSTAEDIEIGLARGTSFTRFATFRFNQTSGRFILTVNGTAQPSRPFTSGDLFEIRRSPNRGAFTFQRNGGQIIDTIPGLFSGQRILPYVDVRTNNKFTTGRMTVGIPPTNLKLHSSTVGYTATHTKDIELETDILASKETETTTVIDMAIIRTNNEFETSIGMNVARTRENNTARIDVLAQRTNNEFTVGCDLIAKKFNNEYETFADIRPVIVRTLYADSNGDSQFRSDILCQRTFNFTSSMDMAIQRQNIIINRYRADILSQRQNIIINRYRADVLAQRVNIERALPVDMVLLKTQSFNTRADVLAQLTNIVIDRYRADVLAQRVNIERALPVDMILLKTQSLTTGNTDVLVQLRNIIIDRYAADVLAQRVNNEHQIDMDILPVRRRTRDIRHDMIAKKFDNEFNEFIDILIQRQNITFSGLPAMDLITTYAHPSGSSLRRSGTGDFSSSIANDRKEWRETIPQRANVVITDTTNAIRLGVGPEITFDQNTTTTSGIPTYSIVFNQPSSGMFSIFYLGNRVGSVGTFVSGDQFEIRKTGPSDVVTIYQNGRVAHTFTQTFPPRVIYRMNVSMHSGGEIARISSGMEDAPFYILGSALNIEYRRFILGRILHVYAADMRIILNSVGVFPDLLVQRQNNLFATSADIRLVRRMTDGSHRADMIVKNFDVPLPIVADVLRIATQSKEVMVDIRLVRVISNGSLALDLSIPPPFHPVYKTSTLTATSAATNLANNQLVDDTLWNDNKAHTVRFALSVPTSNYRVRLGTAGLAQADGYAMIFGPRQGPRNRPTAGVLFGNIAVDVYIEYDEGDIFEIRKTATGEVSFWLEDRNIHTFTQTLTSSNAYRISFNATTAITITGFLRDGREPFDERASTSWTTSDVGTATLAINDNFVPFDMVLFRTVQASADMIVKKFDNVLSTAVMDIRPVGVIDLSLAMDLSIPPPFNPVSTSTLTAAGTSLTFTNNELVEDVLWNDNEAHTVRFILPEPTENFRVRLGTPGATTAHNGYSMVFGPIPNNNNRPVSSIHYNNLRVGNFEFYDEGDIFEIRKTAAGEVSFWLAGRNIHTFTQTLTSANAYRLGFSTTAPVTITGFLRDGEETFDARTSTMWSTSDSILTRAINDNFVPFDMVLFKAVQASADILVAVINNTLSTVVMDLRLVRVRNISFAADLNIPPPFHPVQGTSALTTSGSLSWFNNSLVEDTLWNDNEAHVARITLPANTGSFRLTLGEETQSQFPNGYNIFFNHISGNRRLFRAYYNRTEASFNRNYLEGFAFEIRKSAAGEVTIWERGTLFYTYSQSLTSGNNFRISFASTDPVTISEFSIDTPKRVFNVRNSTLWSVDSKFLTQVINGGLVPIDMVIIRGIPIYADIALVRSSNTLSTVAADMRLVRVRDTSFTMDLSIPPPFNPVYRTSTLQVTGNDLTFDNNRIRDRTIWNSNRVNTARFVLPIPTGNFRVYVGFRRLDQIMGHSIVFGPRQGALNLPTASIHYDGTRVGNFQTYDEGDVFEIRKTATGQVSFWLDGSLIYTFSQLLTGPIGDRNLNFESTVPVTITGVSVDNDAIRVSTNQRWTISSTTGTLAINDNFVPFDMILIRGIPINADIITTNPTRTISSAVADMIVVRTTNMSTAIDLTIINPFNIGGNTVLSASGTLTWTNNQLIEDVVWNPNIEHDVRIRLPDTEGQYRFTIGSDQRVQEPDGLFSIYFGQTLNGGRALSVVLNGIRQPINASDEANVFLYPYEENNVIRIYKPENSSLIVVTIGNAVVYRNIDSFTLSDNYRMSFATTVPITIPDISVVAPNNFFLTRIATLWTVQKQIQSFVINNGVIGLDMRLVNVRNFRPVIDMRIITRVGENPTPVDMVLLKTNEMRIGSDVIIKLPNQTIPEQAADLLTQRTDNTVQIGMNMVLLATLRGSFGADILTQRTGIEHSLSADIPLSKEFTHDVETDVLIRQTYNQEVDVDTHVVLRLSRELHMDVALLDPFNRTRLPVDMTLINRNANISTEIDIVLVKATNLETDVDVYISKAYEFEVEFDIPLQITDIIETPIDIILQMLNIRKEILADMNISIARTLEAPVDLIVKAFDTPTGLRSDIVVKAFNKTFEIGADLIGILRDQTIEESIDIIVKAFDTPTGLRSDIVVKAFNKTFEIGADLIAILRDQIVRIAIDIVPALTNREAGMPADIILKSINNTHKISQDIKTVLRITKETPLDIVLAIKDIEMSYDAIITLSRRRTLYADSDGRSRFKAITTIKKIGQLNIDMSMVIQGPYTPPNPHELGLIRRYI